MRKAFIAFMAVAMGLCIASASNAAAIDNLGRSEAWTFQGHVLTSPEGAAYGRGLYAPSESDDPGLRSLIAAQKGSPVDYFDARAATPTAAQLAAYAYVFTWANYAYSNNVLFGDRLADFVDGGGCVVLGAFCAYTSGNYLSGRIMQCPYAPVKGGFNHFAYACWSGDGAAACVHSGSTSYCATYRDILTLLPCGHVIGHFTDGEISIAANETGTVWYLNGAGGAPVDGPWANEIANAACNCIGPTATEQSTWGAIKGLYQ